MAVFCLIEMVALNQTQITVEECIDVGFELQCGSRGDLSSGGGDEALGWRATQLSEPCFNIIIPGERLLLLYGLQLLGTRSEY